MREAGAIPTTGLTAIQGIDDALQVKSGESVAIVGASGGVGTLAVQFAKLLKARVLGVASGEDGVALVHRLGADVAVDERAGDLADVLQQFAPEGIDAVLALAGGKTLDRVVESVKKGVKSRIPTASSPSRKNATESA
jgi:NADPH-dependent curcumin reductase CurA